MNKTFKRIKLEISRFYNTEQNASFSYTLTAALIYCLLFFYSSMPTSVQLSSLFSSDIATISGILTGFLFTALGILISTKNTIMNRLYITNNINVVFKVFFQSITSFVFVLIFYFIKLFLITDTISLTSTNPINNIVIFIVVHGGLFSFLNAFILFLASLRFLKRILITNKY